MCEWVWFAGLERLKHLALMRASAASRRFALLNILLLAAGLGLAQGAQVGWRPVTNSPAIEPTGSTAPAGQGWTRVAVAPRSLPPGQPPEMAVELWWNPAQALIATVLGAVVGLLLMGLVLLLIRAGVLRAHTRPYRREQRMTAAIHYSTAWCVLIFLATIVLGLRPLSFMGKIARWPLSPPERGLVFSAALLAGFGVIMWWFWLVRLGVTAPERTRGRVIAFFALGAPMIVAGVAAAWWLGLDRVYDPLFNTLHLGF